MRLPSNEWHFYFTLVYLFNNSNNCFVHTSSSLVKSVSRFPICPMPRVANYPYLNRPFLEDSCTTDTTKFVLKSRLLWGSLISKTKSQCAGKESNEVCPEMLFAAFDKLVLNLSILFLKCLLKSGFLIIIKLFLSVRLFLFTLPTARRLKDQTPRKQQTKNDSKKRRIVNTTFSNVMQKWCNHWKNEHQWKLETRFGSLGLGIC